MNEFKIPIEPGEPVYPTESEIIRASVSTAGLFNDVDLAFDFRRVVDPGARILDVGGGGSDVTLTLLDRGVDAYAVDPRYAEMEEIEQSVRQGISRMRVLAIDPQHLNAIYEFEDCLERFVKSAEANPEHYIAAPASNLPFPGEYFDLVFSYHAITDFCSLNPQVFLNSVNECLRVTKIGGKVQFYPYDKNFEPEANLQIETLIAKSMRLVSEMALFDALQKAGVDFEIMPALSHKWKKLVITKTANVSLI